MGKKALLLLLFLLVILQFFRGNSPEVRLSNPDDILLHYDVPDQVAGILKTACYDCHSMETRFPWYSYVTPVSWFLFDHIEEGRSELNFSDWNSMEKRRKIRKLREVGEEVIEGNMPIESYTSMHKEALLTSEQRAMIQEWAESLALQTMKE